MMQITSEHVDLYLDDYFSTKTGSEELSFRQGLGLVCAFDSDPQFLNEIILPDPFMYKLYKEAEAYIHSRIKEAS